MKIDMNWHKLHAFIFLISVNLMLKKIANLLHPKSSLLHKSKFTFMGGPSFDAEKDYYKILQVDKSASDADIKKSYYRLAKMYHPDVNKGNQSKFKDISEAYGVLSDQKLKKQYEAARNFTGFRRKMGRKAASGQYQYQSYQQEYDSMTEEQKEQIRQQISNLMRKVTVFGIGFVVFMLVFTRRNHIFFTEINGQLLPVEFQGGSYYPPNGLLVTPQIQQQPGVFYAQPPYQQQLSPIGNIPPPSNPMIFDPYDPKYRNQHPQNPIQPIPATGYPTYSQGTASYPPPPPRFQSNYDPHYVPAQPPKDL